MTATDDRAERTAVVDADRPVRVALWCRQPADDPEALRAAYHQVSRRLVGTPGLLGNQLLSSALDSGAWLVLSEWASLAAFQRWETGPDHRACTAPLRPFQDSGRARPYDLFVEHASY